MQKGVGRQRDWICTSQGEVAFGGAQRERFRAGLAGGMGTVPAVGEQCLPVAAPATSSLATPPVYTVYLQAGGADKAREMVRRCHEALDSLMDPAAAVAPAAAATAGGK